MRFYTIRLLKNMALLSYTGKFTVFVASLTTREAAWYIISVVSVCLSECSMSVCMYVCMLNDNFPKPLHKKFIFCTSGIYPGNTGLVRVWRSSGQSQRHRSKKGRACRSCIDQLPSAIFTSNRQMTPRSLILQGNLVKTINLIQIALKIW